MFATTMCLRFQSIVFRGKSVRSHCKLAAEQQTDTFRDELVNIAEHLVAREMEETKNGAKRGENWTDIYHVK